MAISQVAFNITHAVNNEAKAVVNSAKQKFNSLIGQIGARMESFAHGSFTGMSEGGIQQLQQAIKEYAQGIQDEINAFNADANMDEAYKGSIGEASREFVGAVKELLGAYVSLLRKLADETKEAYDNWIQSGQQVSQDIQSSSQDIRSQAQSIRLD